MALNRGGALAHNQIVVSAGNDGRLNRSTHLSWRRVPPAALADTPTRRLDLQLAPTRRAKRRRPAEASIGRKPAGIQPPYGQRSAGRSSPSQLTIAHRAVGSRRGCSAPQAVELLTDCDRGYQDMQI